EAASWQLTHSLVSLIVERAMLKTETTERGNPLMSSHIPVESWDYAHPEKLVSTEWVAENKSNPNVVVLESIEDTLLYSTGHISGAVKIDWHTELNDPVTRDFIGPEAFAKMAGSKGISRDTTVIFYGDKSNWWAAYAL